MPSNINIRLPAKLQYLEQLVDFAASCLKEHGVETKRIGEIKVAVEEALVNVINYAYGDREGSVEVVCWFENDRSIINIIDSGLPFDLLSHKDPDISLDVSEREIGGLGIYLIKKLVDHVEYKRENDKNVLTLIVENKQCKD